MLCRKPQRENARSAIGRLGQHKKAKPHGPMPVVGHAMEPRLCDLLPEARGGDGLAEALSRKGEKRILDSYGT